MAGTTTKRSTTGRSTAKAPDAPKEDPKVQALEAKVADLESKLASLTEALQKLEAAPAAPAPVSSKDVGLRSELRKYFKTVNNNKVATHQPNLD